jgi:hypothetical protein
MANATLRRLDVPFGSNELSTEEYVGFTRRFDIKRIQIESRDLRLGLTHGPPLTI